MVGSNPPVRTTMNILVNIVINLIVRAIALPILLVGCILAVIFGTITMRGGEKIKWVS